MVMMMMNFFSLIKLSIYFKKWYKASPLLYIVHPLLLFFLSFWQAGVYVRRTIILYSRKNQNRMSVVGTASWGAGVTYLSSALRTCVGWSLALSCWKTPYQCLRHIVRVDCFVQFTCGTLAKFSATKWENAEYSFGNLCFSIQVVWLPSWCHGNPTIVPFSFYDLVEHCFALDRYSNFSHE